MRCYAEAVCSTLPSLELTESPVSSLGSLKSLQAACSFPVHPLLENLIYTDWLHPDKRFSPPRRFEVLYPMEEKFTKKWSLPSVDAAISSVNKNLTCPVDNAQVFKDPSENRLES